MMKQVETSQSCDTDVNQCTCHRASKRNLPKAGPGLSRQDLEPLGLLLLAASLGLGGQDPPGSVEMLGRTVAWVGPGLR